MSVMLPRPRPAQWLRILFGTTSTGPAGDVALLALRVALAWVFIYYGAAKLFGAFPGSGGPHGIHQTSIYMAQSAHLRPGGLFAVLAGLIEFGGGIAMALGFLTRIGGLALLGDMVIAMITVTWGTGINPIGHTGYQLNIALAAMTLAAALTGSGRFSLDALIARSLRQGRAVSARPEALAGTKAA
jgi:putative oxidoreductase